MKKILSTLTILACAGTVVAFDEDNAKLEAVTEVASAANIELPIRPVRSVAMSDDDFAAETQDFEDCYNDLAYLAQNDVPGLEDDVTIE